jgi:hypothetical protein
MMAYTYKPYNPNQPYKPYDPKGLEIVAMLKEHPELLYREIGAKFGVSEFRVGAIAKRVGLQHGRPGRRPHVIAMSSLVNPKHVSSERRARAKQEGRIIAYVQAHPEMTYLEIAQAFGVKKFMIGNLMYKSGVRRSRVDEKGLAQKVEMVEYIKKHPLASYSDMSRETGWKTRDLAQVAREAGLFRGKGQGPTHNYGRAHGIATRGHLSRTHLAQRARFRDIMLKAWDAAGDKHRRKMSRIMKSYWTPQARKSMSLALTSMWKDANA